MIMVLLSILLSFSYTPLSFTAEPLEESPEVRCSHGGQQIPIVICTPSSHCVTTTCSFATTATVAIPASGVTAGITVPGPSAAYTSLSISGTLTANQVCASNVTAANMESLFFSSGYYSQMSDYQILRSNASIFGNFGNELIITATDGAVGDFFGGTVAISGNGSIIVVGANNAQNFQGTAYIYRREGNTWALLQEIQDPPGDGNFGSQVAISYDASTIAICSGFLNVCYLYQYTAALDQYVYLQSITNITSSNLSATGQYLVGINALDLSAVVYVRNDMCAGRGSVWTLQQELIPPLNLFSFVAAISSDASTIALQISNLSNNIPGAVQIYTRSGTQWSLVQTLTASDGIAGDNFGIAIALSNNGQYLLVGAPNNGTGKAYEFVNRGGIILWTQENEFFPPASVSEFGISVAISGDGTIGSIGRSAVGIGDVFIVLRSPDNIWTMPSRFSGHTASAALGFSTALSADGAFMVAGAPDALGVTPGSISIFRPVGAIIPADTIITGSLCVNSNMTIDSDLLVTGSIFVQGSVIAGGATPCSALSDRRLKKNIEPLPTLEAFQKIQLLRPVTFSWVNPEEHPGESNPSAGLIAQDVERDFAHWVRRGRATGKDTQLVSSADPARLVEITPELYAYLVACIKGLEESGNYKDTLMAKYKGLS